MKPAPFELIFNPVTGENMLYIAPGQFGINKNLELKLLQISASVAQLYPILKCKPVFGPGETEIEWLLLTEGNSLVTLSYGDKEKPTPHTVITWNINAPSLAIAEEIKKEIETLLHSGD